MEQNRPAKAGHGAGYGMAFLLAGLLAAIGAWRSMRHHDGFALEGLPLATMVILCALRAGRASGGERT